MQVKLNLLYAGQKKLSAFCLSGSHSTSEDYLISTAFTTLTRQYLLSNVLFEKFKRALALGNYSKGEFEFKLSLLRENVLPRLGRLGNYYNTPSKNKIKYLF